MIFADLHIHPTLKTQFTDAIDKFKPDENVVPDVVLNSFVNLCSDMSDVIESQANIRQLVDNNVKIACFALYSPEPEIIGNANLAKAVKNNPTANRYISKTRLEAFRNGTIKPFEFTRDYELATALSLNYPDLGRVIPLQKNTTLDDSTAKDIYVVFSVEGCHSLLNSFNDYKNMNTIAGIITGNLQSLINSGAPIISVNLTHLVDYPLCNHAFGMQFLYDEGFFPKTNGLSQAAKDVADWCYNNHVHVDIKHLSIKSRFDLYAVRNNNGTDLPIICSHAGFAGIRRRQYADYIFRLEDDAPDYYYLEVCKPRGYFDQTSFNANNINLYDEDIAEILRTGGVIGLSLDKRILGFTDPSVTTYAPQDRPDQLLEVDYFSYHEYHDPVLFANKTDFGAKTDNNNCLFVNELDNLTLTGTAIKDLHFRHLVNHFVHLYIIADQNQVMTGLKPIDAVKNHLCIGSDFDGLINPIACTISVEKLDWLYNYFKAHFRTAFNEGSGASISTATADTIINNFFYHNAKRFVTGWVATKP
jgi:microsomal dipeptidase-like Zn-dependent dipeptidase